MQPADDGCGESAQRYRRAKLQERAPSHRGRMTLKVGRQRLDWFPGTREVRPAGEGDHTIQRGIKEQCVDDCQDSKMGTLVLFGLKGHSHLFILLTVNKSN